MPVVLEYLTSEAGLVLHEAPDPVAGSHEGRKTEEEGTCFKAGRRYEVGLGLVLTSLEFRHQEPALRTNCSCLEKHSCYGV